MDACIFCKIVAGDIPAHKVYEDDAVIAFLDIHPVNKGHVLVVPKKHSTDYMHAEAETLQAITLAAQKVAGAVTSAVAADGFNIGINTGGAAGQVIFHLHWHIIPRFHDDALQLWPGRSYGEGEAERLAGEIRAAL